MPNYHQAALNVAQRFPSYLGDESFKKRMDRAYDMLVKGGYDIKRANNVYHVSRASTSLFEDNSITYEVTDNSCSCPDFEKGQARGDLCKHRLAVMILQEVDIIQADDKIERS